MDEKKVARLAILMLIAFVLAIASFFFAISHPDFTIVHINQCWFGVGLIAVSGALYLVISGHACEASSLVGMCQLNQIKRHRQK